MSVPSLCGIVWRYLSHDGPLGMLLVESSCELINLVCCLRRTLELLPDLLEGFFSVKSIITTGSAFLHENGACNHRPVLHLIGWPRGWH